MTSFVTTVDKGTSLLDFDIVSIFIINRYRRGLETCPQPKTSKSGHALSFSFFRRVRATSMTQRRVENTRVHFWTFPPVSVNSTVLRALCRWDDLFRLANRFNNFRFDSIFVTFIR